MKVRIRRRNCRRCCLICNGSTLIALSTVWSGPSVQCGRTRSVQIHRGSLAPSHISDISESQDELLADVILALRSNAGPNSLLRVWARDQRFQLHCPTHNSTHPCVDIQRPLPEPQLAPTLLLPLLVYSKGPPPDSPADGISLHVCSLPPPCYLAVWSRPARHSCALSSGPIIKHSVGDVFHDRGQEGVVALVQLCFVRLPAAFEPATASCSHTRKGLSTVSKQSFGA